MILLLDLETSAVERLAKQYGPIVGQLQTPRHQYVPPAKLAYAADNAAYSGFDAAAFARMVSRIRRLGHCKWVAAPDVVGNARLTLDAFRHWYPQMEGLPIALVAQDGLEDCEIPWGLIDAVFVGGSTAWKMSHAADEVVDAAKIIGKWVHVGRVNSIKRMHHFISRGIDSIDGSGNSTNRRQRAYMLRALKAASQSPLFG